MMRSKAVLATFEKFAECHFLQWVLYQNQFFLAIVCLFCV